MTTIKFKEIKRENRIREDYGDLRQLVESIKRYGLIHPVTINQDGLLIAGGRRSECLARILADAPKEKLHPTIASFVNSGGEMFFGVHFIFKDATEYEAGELELEENVVRKNFSWKEEVKAVAKMHNLYRKKFALEGSSWSQEQTARLLGKEQASVSYTLRLAAEFSNAESPVHKAENPTQALQLLAQARAQELEAKHIRRSTITKPATSEDAFNLLAEAYEAQQDALEDSRVPRDPDDHDLEEEELPEPVDFSEEAFAPPPVEKPVVEVVKLSEKLFHSSIESLLELLGKGFVDHIITDPPYGIDMDNLNQSGSESSNITSIASTHEVDSNLTAFPKWLTCMYDALGDNGFCVIFCDPTHFETLRTLATSIGFRSQRWPLAWIKTHPCKNEAAQFNFTKALEFALVLRKGTVTLAKPQPRNFWMGSRDGYAPNHPFAKPEALWKWIAEAIAFKGQTIGDFFSGSGSGPHAFIRSGYNFVSCEINEDFYNQQRIKLEELYKTALGDVRFE